MLNSISLFLSFNLTERFWRFLFHVTTGADGIVGHIRERIRLFLIVWLVELRGLFPHLLSDFLHCDRLYISASVGLLLEKFFITLWRVTSDDQSSLLPLLLEQIYFQGESGFVCFVIGVILFFLVTHIAMIKYVLIRLTDQLVSQS